VTPQGVAPTPTPREETVMGYNRSGQRRKERLKRHKKLVNRLAARQEAGAADKKAPAPAK
jgi:hypothetical protein